MSRTGGRRKTRIRGWSSSRTGGTSGRRFGSSRSTTRPSSRTSSGGRSVCTLRSWRGSGSSFSRTGPPLWSATGVRKRRSGSGAGNDRTPRTRSRGSRTDLRSTGGERLPPRSSGRRSSSSSRHRTSFRLGHGGFRGTSRARSATSTRSWTSAGWRTLSRARKTETRGRGAWSIGRSRTRGCGRRGPPFRAGSRRSRRSGRRTTRAGYRGYGSGGETFFLFFARSTRLCRGGPSRTGTRSRSATGRTGRRSRFIAGGSSCSLSRRGSWTTRTARRRLRRACGSGTTLGSSASHRSQRRSHGRSGRVTRTRSRPCFRSWSGLPRSKGSRRSGTRPATGRSGSASSSGTRQCKRRHRRRSLSAKGARAARHQDPKTGTGTGSETGPTRIRAGTRPVDNSVGTKSRRAKVRRCSPR